jgi:hypothetical protein
MTEFKADPTRGVHLVGGARISLLTLEHHRIKSQAQTYIRDFLTTERQRADDIISPLHEPVNRLGHAPSTGTDGGNEAPGAPWRVKSWPRIRDWDRGFLLARVFPYPRIPI